MDRIEKILCDVRLEMAEIRVAISDVDRELPPGDPYRLTVFGIVDAEAYHNNPDVRAVCEEAFQEFLEALRSCKEILVEDGSELLPGNEFDWQSARLTDLWNFANLTDTALGD